MPGAPEGMRLSVGNPDELLAAIPHLLGFTPEESIVFLPLQSGLPVARVDIPRTARDRETVWGSIRDVFNRYAVPATSIGIVCVTADRWLGEQVAEDFTARLDSIDIATRVRVWADGMQWRDLDSGVTGRQSEAARERVAALTVMNGRVQPAASRDSLAMSLVGDRAPVANVLAEVRAVAAETTPRAEGTWALGRVKQFQADGVRLTDVEAARLLLAVDSTPTRDSVWRGMSRANVSSHVALWTDLTRRAPDEVRAAPASLLGFASWLSGDGAKAWCALDQVPPGKPYPLAGLVATAVQRGVHPREWEAATSRATERSVGHAPGLDALQSSVRQSPARPAPGL